MRTWSGRESLLDTDRPNPVDLVVHMGRIQRFGGAGKSDWTVLHHSMLVGLIWLRLRPHYDWPLYDLPAVLLHDAHEGVMGCDIPGPVKRALGTKGQEALRGLEATIDEKIRTYFHISPPSNHKTPWFAPKLCDRLALIIEEIHFGPPNILYDEIENTLAHSDFKSKDAAYKYLWSIIRMLHEIDPFYGCQVAEVLGANGRPSLFCRCQAPGLDAPGAGYCPMNLDPERREEPVR